MGRTRKYPPGTEPTRKLAPDPPVDIGSLNVLILHDDALFTVDQLQSWLHLTASSLRREVRLGRLQVSRRCNRLLVLGAWVKQWLVGGVKQEVTCGE